MILQTLSPYVKGDPGRMKRLENMFETCENEIGEQQDKCVAAKKLAECIQKHGNEFGFQMPARA